MKCLTYNIHKGFNWSGNTFVLAAIRDQLRELDPDVVCIQEVIGERRGSPEKLHFEFLASGHFPHWVYGKNAVYATGHHGNAILSKWPILHWDNINVSARPNWSRSLLHAVVQGPTGRSHHFVCVHLGLLEAERKKSIQVLCRRIRDHVPREEALVIAGDFNDWRGRVEKYLEQELGLKEVFLELSGKHASSFPSFLPLLSLDRIYFRGLQPLKCVCPREEGVWRGLSDHLPLWAEFSDFSCTSDGN